MVSTKGRGKVRLEEGSPRGDINSDMRKPSVFDCSSSIGMHNYPPIPSPCHGTMVAFALPQKRKTDGRTEEVAPYSVLVHIVLMGPDQTYRLWLMVDGTRELSGLTILYMSD